MHTHQRKPCSNIPLCSSVHSIVIRQQQLIHTHTNYLFFQSNRKLSLLGLFSVTLCTHCSVCTAPLESYVRAAAVCTASKLAAHPRGFQKACSCVHTHMKICIHAKLTHSLTFFNPAYQMVTSGPWLTLNATAFENISHTFTVMVTESLFRGSPDTVGWFRSMAPGFVMVHSAFHRWRLWSRHNGEKKVGDKSARLALLWEIPWTTLAFTS